MSYIVGMRVVANQAMSSKHQLSSSSRRAWNTRGNRRIDSPSTAVPVAKDYDMEPAIPASAKTTSGKDSSDIEGLYIISVASRLLEMHPQTLRKYERMGLVKPSRTVGMLRLYSEGDIAKLRVVKYLVEEVGLNLAGVELALEMMERLEQMYRHISSLAEPQTVRESVIIELQHILEMFETEVPE